MVELVNKHIRLTSEQDRRLRSISAMTGESVNEIIRLAIDHIDDQRLQKILHDRPRQQRQDMLLIASNKYLAYTINRVGNNLNQIARRVNGDDEIDCDSLTDALIDLTDQVNKLRSEIDEYCKSHQLK